MIVVTGDSGVGKSALLQKFGKPEKSWDQMDSKATIGVDYVRRPLKVEGRSIMLQSWDTAGQERFRTITTSYYRSAMGAIICFDITSEQSLKSAKNWIKDFRDKARQGAPVLLVATKQDLSDQPKIKITGKSNGNSSNSQSGSSGETSEMAASQPARLLLPV